MLKEVCLLVLVLLFYNEGADAHCCDYVHWECCHYRQQCGDQLGSDFEKKCGQFWKPDACQFMGDGTVYWIYPRPGGCVPDHPVVKHPKTV